MDYYEILGVSPDCDRETLHRAFRDLSLKFHPDRYTETARKLAEKRYQKMVKAFNTLKDRKLRERYDRLNNVFSNGQGNGGNTGKPSSANSRSVRDSGSHRSISLNQIDPKQLAKQHMQAGMTKVGRGEWSEALEHFNACTKYMDKDAEFHFYKGQCEMNLAAFHRQAVSSFQKAVQLQPKQAKYHVHLIKAFAKFGLKSRVDAAMERALKLMPDQPELLALDQQLHPEKYKKGLFKNLFSKK